MCSLQARKELQHCVCRADGGRSQPELIPLTPAVCSSSQCSSQPGVPSNKNTAASLTNKREKKYPRLCHLLDGGRCPSSVDACCRVMGHPALADQSTWAKTLAYIICLTDSISIAQKPVTSFLLTSSLASTKSKFILTIQQQDPALKPCWLLSRALPRPDKECFPTWRAPWSPWRWPGMGCFGLGFWKSSASWPSASFGRTSQQACQVNRQGR